MKTKKLKSFILPAVYVMVIGALFISISFIGKALQSQIRSYDEDLSVNAITKDEAVPVVKEQEENIVKSTIVKPFTSSNVGVSKSYYDMADSETEQQNSLVYFEKTYMQNSGILYSSTEEFDVVSVYDGKVTNVAKDDILGNYVEITHNTNLKTIYYSLGEVVVKKDDEVKSGTIIAKSGDNELENESNNSLLFEVHYNGYTMDPEYFYTVNIDDLN